MKLRICILFMMIFTHSFSWSNESAPEGKSMKAGPPWGELENSVSVGKNKEKKLEETLKALMLEKRQSTGTKREQLEIEIKKTHKEWTEVREQLRKDLVILRYRFPERAAKTKERIYVSPENPSIQEMEEQVGVEGKLQRNLKRMKQQYGKTQDRREPVPEIKVESQTDQKNIREQEAPILSK